MIRIIKLAALAISASSTAAYAAAPQTMVAAAAAACCALGVCAGLPCCG